jgi:tetratricopeptide (TPR) repeat protein
VELRRLLQLARAYRYVEEADAAVGQGRYEDAAAAYQTAMALAPQIAELKAWAAIALVQMGQEREALPLFETTFRAGLGLVELLPRVAALGLVQVDPTLLEQVAGLVPGPGALLTVDAWLRLVH